MTTGTATIITATVTIIPIRLATTGPRASRYSGKRRICRMSRPRNRRSTRERSTSISSKRPSSKDLHERPIPQASCAWPGWAGRSAGSGTSMYVPLNFVSEIPRGDTIYLTVTKAQASEKNWDKPPR